MRVSQLIFLGIGPANLSLVSFGAWHSKKKSVTTHARSEKSIHPVDNFGYLGPCIVWPFLDRSINITNVCEIKI